MTLPSPNNYNHIIAGTCSGIPYILVIVTPIDIFLLGVTFGDVNATGMN